MVSFVNEKSEKKKQNFLGMLKKKQFKMFWSTGIDKLVSQDFRVILW